jgi:hypothetical protein
VAGGDRKSADDVLITALAGGKPVAQAAKLAGVSERTVYRRLADSLWRRRVAAARTEMLARAVGVLAEGTAAAAATLRLLLRSDSPSVQLAAARAILDQTTRGIELLDLADRVTALEEQATAAEQFKGRNRWST